MKLKRFLTVWLMQNRQYRLGAANALMGYYYPPQPGIEK
jgi:hypothetical protein